ncbi:MAG: NrfD/PsrC family molybdoenzyme membrane anchor subunit [Limisphaerales bacterium]
MSTNQTFVEPPSQTETAVEQEGRRQTKAALESKVLNELAGTLAPSGRLGRLWIGFLLTVIFAALGAYAWQLAYGLKVTGMREYISWGVYITNFVFFIGVSHAGTLISAILRVTNAEWRRSITRMAEAITVFALLVGAPMVLIDLGRVDRVLNIIIHGRLNSPLLWDVCSICTYITGSLLYLYVAMIPDMGLLASSTPKEKTLTWRWRLYNFLSLGYRGTPEQRRILERALGAMAVIIIPVAISVHTVVSWIFGMTLRPGWHSTIFGPYFVIGAIFSGTAALITAMAIFRKVYHLEHYLTERQFLNLGRLMLALNMLYIYFTLSEYLTAWYGSEATDKRLIDLLMGHGFYGIAFWSWAAFGLFLPALITGAPFKKNLIQRLVIASILINVGMWVKRYLIIVPTLMTPYIPAEAGGIVPHYHPTLIEWMITAGGLAMFMLLFTLFAKLFPIVSIWETVEGVEELGAKQIGVEIELPRIASAPFAPRAATVLLILGLLSAASTSLAAEPAASRPQPEIAVRSGIEDGKHVIVAAVTLNGKPVGGVKIAFFVERTFGRLALGAEETIDDGTAAVPFPTGLPGGPAGELRVVAEVKSPPKYAATRVQVSLPGGAKVLPETDPFPRALWSPKAPVGLLLTIVVLLSIVWTTYAFVLTQLIKIRKGAR